MKKILTALIILMAGAAFTFAEAAPAPTPAPAAPAAVVAKDLTGTIQAVVKADAAKKTEAELTIKSTDGKTTVLVAVAATAKLIGADKKAVAFDKLAKGAKVEIKYTEGKPNTLVELTVAK